jgi:RNA polymerase sigma factor (sigma-70 family)
MEVVVLRVNRVSVASLSPPALGVVPANTKVAEGGTIVGVAQPVQATPLAVAASPGWEAQAHARALGAAFEAFYRQEYRAVVAVAYALTGKAAVAEELAQDAFLVAHRRWSQISSYDAPGAYVRRVVANMAVSFGRRLAAEARALARLAARSAPGAWAAPLEPTDADFWRAVRSLPRRQAQVLVLRYLEDRSDAEIAHILGCAENTVRVHLHNGRRSLAARLGLALGEEP